MKKFKKITTAFILLMVLVLTISGCSSDNKDSGDDQAAGDQPAQIQAIIDRGVLRVGVKEDVPNFGLRNTATNEIEGFEIDLVKKIALAILGDETKYELTPVTAKTRGALLDNGDIDMVIATFTVTEERKLTYNFSTTYYTDSVGLLVKKTSGYTTLADMDGATIGVAQGATSQDAINEAATALGIEVSFNEYATYSEIKAALDSNRVQVFAVDKSILSGYVDDSTEILADSFSPQEYGIATKLDNKDLASYVDGLVKGWLSDGTIETMLTTWSLEG